MERSESTGDAPQWWLFIQRSKEKEGSPIWIITAPRFPPSECQSSGRFPDLLDNRTVRNSRTSLLLDIDGFIIWMYLRARLCSPWHMRDWMILMCCHDTVLIVAGWKSRAREFWTGWEQLDHHREHTPVQQTQKTFCSKAGQGLDKLRCLTNKILDPGHTSKNSSVFAEQKHQPYKTKWMS